MGPLLGRTMNYKLALSSLAVSTLLTTGLTGSAYAASTDFDRDGMPNRYERTHGLDARDASDARRDLDRDGLTNLGEYRNRTDLRDEDSDADGMDDGDEVKDGRNNTEPTDADTDNDEVLDGDEDADRDSEAN